MPLRPFFIAIITITLISACGRSDNHNVPSPISSSQLIAEQYQGIWQAPGYALSMNISEDGIQIYQNTSDYCLVLEEESDIDTQDIESFLQVSEIQGQLEWHAGFGTSAIQVPGLQFERVNAIPSSCQTNILSMKGDENYTFDPLEIWHLYEQIFSEYYVDFDNKGLNWSQISADAAFNLHSGSSEFDLLMAMADSLEPLADGHNFVASAEGLSAKFLTKPTLIARLVEEYAIDNGLPFPIPSELLSEDGIADLNLFITQHLENQWSLVSQYAPQEPSIKSASNGLIRWFKNDDIGYLNIAGMTGYADQTSLDETEYVSDSIDNLNAALNVVLQDFADINGLIIDVRTNDGGHDFISLAIANRFAATSTHAYSKQARDGNSRTPLLDVYLEPTDTPSFYGPVVLLTSSSTVSAAEVFTLSMSQLPNVTIAGEATHGALSNVMEWRLPNGFEVGLSNEFYLSPQGEWFETTGIPVDLNVPFYTPEQRELEIDLGIETAVVLLTQ